MIVVKDKETDSFMIIPVDTICYVKENSIDHSAKIVFEPLGFPNSVIGVQTIPCKDSFDSIVRILKGV